MQTPIQAALSYASWGVQVFPVHTPNNGLCSCHIADCSSSGKHPRTQAGLKDATTDYAQIRRWWQRWPDANIGIRTGRESNIVVLDLDEPYGERTLRELMILNGSLPRTMMVASGGGGRHYYFKHPGVTIRNDAGQRLGPNVDVRGDGGYIVGPPSVHASGRHYVWAMTPAMADLPRWLVERLKEAERSHSHAPVAAPEKAMHWAQTAFERETENVRQAKEGQRNGTLNKAAFALGQLVGANYLDSETVEQALITVGLATGLAEREVVHTVLSGLTAGAENPRGPAQTMQIDR